MVKRASEGVVDAEPMNNGLGVVRTEMVFQGLETSDFVTM